MRSKRLVPLLAFALTAAVTTAALVDPLVEHLSNAGAFGAGNFTDHSTLDVLPALCAATLLVVLSLIGIVRHTLRSAGGGPRWLRVPALGADGRTLVRLLPVIYAVELAVVFLMETVEQAIVAGHALGGTLWLGGPVAASLSFHAAGCILVSAALSIALRWSAQTMLDVVASVFQRMVGGGAVPPAARGAVAHAPARRLLGEYLERLTGSAPPSLSL